MSKWWVVLLIGSICITGCQRIDVRPSIYDPQGIQDVKTWYVGFTYFEGSQTEVTTTQSVDQTTVRRDAPRKDDLQFRDDFEFRLRDKFNIRTMRDSGGAEGTIMLHVTYYAFAGQKSVDVLISDKAGTVLSRIKFVNSQNQAVIDDYERFAWYVADQVGRILRP